MNLQQLINLSKDYIDKKQYTEALEVLNEELKLNPDSVIYILIKSEVYMHLGDFESTEKSLLQALSNSRDNTMVLIRLCDCYYKQRQYAKALDVAIDIMEIEPNNIHAGRAAGMSLRKLGRIEEAVEILKSVVSKEQSYVPGYITLADIYFDLRQYDEAEKYYNVAHHFAPDNVWVINRLCYILHLTFDKNRQDRLTSANQLAHKLINITGSKGQYTVAEQIQNIALTSLDWDLYNQLGDKKQLVKNWINNLTNKPFVLQKSRVEVMQDRFDLVEAHRDWGTKMERTIDRSSINRRVRQRVNNKIRLGISTADFRSNAVGSYIHSMVEYLNKDDFEIYCYAQRPDKRDRMQQKFEIIADDFKEFSIKETNHDVAQTIADDCLDAIIEIGAWCLRAQMIAYRPAPLQISWLDYAHSMGLPTAIDYIVVDPYVKPKIPQLLIEKPMTLPETWIVMKECDEFPPIAITKLLPEDNNGYITFGVMNSSHRLTEKACKTWAEIMNVVPNSRLVYIRPESIATVLQENLSICMEKYGVARNRISFISARKHFMEFYNKIDIALDTFPHMGATTTCYTMWMGLPLVTLVGPCFFERISYSALNNCGLGDLCAFSTKEYRDIVLGLVVDKERRYYIRQHLRDWILNGPLGQPKRFTENMGRAVIDLCGGK